MPPGCHSEAGVRRRRHHHRPPPAPTSPPFLRTFGQPLVSFLAVDRPVEERPPIRVGMVFSGRQSPGGHNVVWGLHDTLKAYNSQSLLYGFIGGTQGLFANKTLEITDDVLASYKNQGGFDLLGRSIDQIRLTKHLNAAMTTCRSLNLDGLVIIGGFWPHKKAG